jgi:hypothetical protein
VAKNFVFLFLFSCGSDFGHSGFGHLAQNAFVFFIKHGVEVIIIYFVSLLF